MSFKKKILKTALNEPQSTVKKTFSTTPSSTAAETSTTTHYYSDSSDFGSYNERTSTEKPFELSRSDDSMDLTTSKTTANLTGTTANSSHPLFPDSLKNKLPPSSNGGNNRTNTLVAQGFRRLQSTSSDDMTLSASESGSTSDVESPKYSKQKKQRIHSFSTRKSDGIAAMSPRVSDFFIPMPQDSNPHAAEKKEQEEGHCDSLSNEDGHQDDDSEETLNQGADAVEHALNLRNLNEMQTKVLIFEYFGSIENYIDRPRSQATTPSHGGFKVTGHDLMFIEEVNDIKELGFHDLPMVKLRRAVQEIKIWREANGELPEEVAKFIMSRCPPPTPKAMEAPSMASAMNASGLLMPAPINTGVNVEQKQNATGSAMNSGNSSSSTTPASMTRMSPQVITPVAAKTNHSPKKEVNKSAKVNSASNAMEPQNAVLNTKTISNNAAISTADSSSSASKISVDEQIYIILCKKKFQEFGLQLPAQLFDSTASSSSSINKLPVSDVAFRAVESRFTGLSPWTTMILVLSTNTQFEELTKFMCKAFGALYRANAIHSAAAAGANSGNASPSAALALQRKLFANNSSLQGEEMASLCRLLFDLLRIYMSNAEVVALVLKTLVCVIQSLLSKILFLLVGNDFVTIISIMAMYKTDPNITAQILPVLQNLLRLKEVKMILFDAGVVDLYVEILSIHKTSMSIVKQIVTAMKMLATTEWNQLQFSNIKTCKVLVETLTIHKSNASMVKPICSAIWNISMPKQTKSLMSEAGCCELLVEILRIHQHNALPMNQILGGIWTLSLSSSNQQIFGSLGVCELLVQILKEHKHVVGIVDQACGAIANLADFADNHVKLVSHGVCDLLLDVLKAYQSNASVAETACGAIGSIIDNDKQGITKFTMSSLGCDLIISALIQHMTVPETVRQICSALKGKLTVSPLSLTNNEAVLRGLGVNELLIIALNTHLSNCVAFAVGGAPAPAAGMQVMKPVLSVMKALIQVPENCAKVILAQAIEALHKCLEVFCTFVDIPLVIECLDLLDLLVKGLSSSAYLTAVKSSAPATTSILGAPVPSTSSPAASAATQKNLIIFNTMLAVISNLKDHEAVVAKCLMVMKKTGVTSPNVMPPGTAGPVITLLVHLLPLHGTCEPIVNQICWMIVSMGTSGLNQVDLLALRFPMIMISLLGRHIANPQCVLHIAWVIANTCYHKVEIAKNFLEESVIAPQPSPMTTVPSAMEPPAPKLKLMTLLSKAICTYHAPNASVVKYICHILMAITSFSSLIAQKSHSLDKRALYTILEKLFPKYHLNKNIMKPLCGILKSMLSADASSVASIAKLNLGPVLAEAKQFFEGEDAKLTEEIDFLISSLDLAETATSPF